MFNTLLTICRSPLQYVFVDVLIWIYLLLCNGCTLPDMPSGVLGLVGISGGSYVLSKGIQKSLGHPF